MPRGSALGDLEQFALSAILSLGDNAYGVSLRKEVSFYTGRDLSPSVLYATLDRLEDQGLVTSTFGDPTPERGGRVKRFFRLSASGAAAVARAQQPLQKLKLLEAVHA